LSAFATSDIIQQQKELMGDANNKVVIGGKCYRL